MIDLLPTSFKREFDRRHQAPRFSLLWGMIGLGLMAGVFYLMACAFWGAIL